VTTRIHRAPVVAAVLPARNEEAGIARAVESLAAQPELAEIIVVNDQSTDATAARLAGLAARFPRLRVLEIADLPAGWVGKNHAAWLGAGTASAGCRWLLFTDADTIHYPDSLSRALDCAVVHDAALVSYSPEQDIRSFAEKAMIPFVYSRLARHFSYERVSDPDLPDAAANGQYLLIAREAYDAAGGHEAVRGCILEDVELARRVKSAGYRLWFASGAGIVRTRMYRSFHALWEGWTKNLYLLAGGTPGAALRELVLAFPWLGIGLLLLAALGFGMEPASRIISAVLGGILLGMAHAVYGAQISRSHYPRSLIQYFMPGAALYAAALCFSAWRNTRGSVEWKGRAYPARTPSGTL
jgi:GT2 family glycosyltransferase